MCTCVFSVVPPLLMVRKVTIHCHLLMYRASFLSLLLMRKQKLRKVYKDMNLLSYGTREENCYSKKKGERIKSSLRKRMALLCIPLKLCVVVLRRI